MGKASIADDEPVFRMSREDYRARAAQQPTGRFELVASVVVAMAPERAGHNRRKRRVYEALDRAVRAAGQPCEVYTDGSTVEVDDSDYEPDAVLHCGDRLSDDAVAVQDPLGIVEVLAPTSASDRALKLREYFRLPSLKHYLIVWSDKQQVVHHRRSDEGEIKTYTAVAGEIRISPPGITISVEDRSGVISTFRSWAVCSGDNRLAC